MSKKTYKKNESLDMLSTVHEDQEATLPSGRSYQLTKMTHNQRRRVFAFFSKRQSEIQTGDFSFLDSEDFEPVEKVIMETVLYEGGQLSKSPAHWDDYPEDYIVFTVTMLGAISYPFLKGSLGG